jgi:hypothetical protein
MYGLFCWGLVRLNGFGFSYVCIWFFLYTDLSVRILLLLGFLCRGLIYQAHLFEYINNLNGFGFSYVWF